MATLAIRAGAVADLRGIMIYSEARYGIELAEAYMGAIDRSFDRLRDFPELGEARADLGTNLRSLPCGEHRIFYRYVGGHISIVRVLHKAMDPRKWLD
ncbi:type II toxin-antitoxin system RelE/ParE family toxin [Sphingomonas sp. MS122]|uniref:type II toxin-antitoxin system RelE/ParE family toxin n=1 Tax=Sphingomonas sp. MS122 TaxID=3412683 RepID=UPI003C30C48B